jgi:hypothetical protein
LTCAASPDAAEGQIAPVTVSRVRPWKVLTVRGRAGSKVMSPLFSSANPVLDLDTLDGYLRRVQAGERVVDEALALPAVRRRGEQGALSAILHYLQ